VNAQVPGAPYAICHHDSNDGDEDVVLLALELCRTTPECNDNDGYDERRNYDCYMRCDDLDLNTGSVQTYDCSTYGMVCIPDMHCIVAPFQMDSFPNDDEEEEDEQDGAESGN